VGRIITLLITSLMMLSLQGCSWWKNDRILSFFQKKETIIPIKNFHYNFQEPVRKRLSQERVRSLKLIIPRGRGLPIKNMSTASSRQYYSANGHLCRVIDTAGSEVVCAISGQWKMSPPVLVSSLLGQ